MLFEEIKKLGKHSLIYGLGTLLSSLLGFVLLPLYTRYLTPGEYGIFSLLIITGNIVAIIAQLGFGSALFREVIYRGSDERIVESTALYFLIGESILFFSVIIYFSPQISAVIFGVTKYNYLLKLVFITNLLNSIRIIVMAKLRIREQSAFYSILSLIYFFIGATLNIYFIVVLRRGLEGLITAGLMLALVFAVIYIMLLLKDLQLTFSVDTLRRLLTFGVPLVPFGLARIVMTSAAPYFLRHFTSTTEVGIYSAAFKISTAINLIVGAVQLAWPAQMYKIARRHDAEKVLARIFIYYLYVLGFIGLGFSVLAREILVVMTTPQFYGAYAVVPFLVLSYIMYGAMYMTNSGLETRNKTKFMFPTMVGAACINLVLNYVLVPRFGMVGAGAASLGAYLILLCVNTVINLHFWHISYEYKRIAKIISVWIVIYACSFMCYTTNTWLTGLFKLVLMTTYPVLLYFLQFYEKKEIIVFKKILSRITLGMRKTS